MILVEDVLILHAMSLRDYGGGLGIRDIGLLESAINRPFQFFDGKELYPTPIEKAAAIAESIIINHPFVDGNKRTGTLAMIAIAKSYGIELIATPENLYKFIISISTGELKFDNIVQWLKQNTEPAK